MVKVEIKNNKGEVIKQDNLTMVEGDVLIVSAPEEYLENQDYLNGLLMSVKMAIEKKAEVLVIPSWCTLKVLSKRVEK